jgi:hypothetical protein
MMMRRLIAIVATAFISSAAIAIEPEPDWSQRLETVKAEELSRFPVPKVGEQITVIRRIGGELTGRITAITSDTITISGTKYLTAQLTPETCDKIFAEQYIAKVARQRVLDERADYNARKQAEIRAQQQETERLAREQHAAEEQARLQREAQQRHAEEQARIQAQQERERSDRMAVISLTAGFIFVGIIVFIIYIVPSVIAFKRGHQNAGAILALNILLGWSFLGWVAALVWSLTSVTNNPARTTALPPSAAPTRSRLSGKKIVIKK